MFTVAGNSHHEVFFLKGKLSVRTEDVSLR